jgi:hypothetical protein
MDIQQQNNPDTLESNVLTSYSLVKIDILLHTKYNDIIRALHKRWKNISFGIQYMVVQREDTTRMETMLLEGVYQGHYVKLESSEIVVG